MQKIKINTAVTRIRTEVAAATTQSTNHYTITARHCAVGEMRYCSFNFDKSVPITVLLCCWIIAGTPDSLSHLPSVTPSQICCIFHFPCVQSLSPHGLPEVIFALSLPPLLHSSLFIFLFWSTVPKPSFWLPWPAERREKGGNARGADGRMKAEQTGRQHRVHSGFSFPGARLDQVRSGSGALHLRGAWRQALRGRSTALLLSESKIPTGFPGVRRLWSGYNCSEKDEWLLLAWKACLHSKGMRWGRGKRTTPPGVSVAQSVSAFGC